MTSICPRLGSCVDRHESTSSADTSIEGGDVGSLDELGDRAKISARVTADLAKALAPELGESDGVIRRPVVLARASDSAKAATSLNETGKMRLAVFALSDVGFSGSLLVAGGVVAINFESRGASILGGGIVSS